MSNEKSIDDRLRELETLNIERRVIQIEESYARFVGEFARHMRMPNEAIEYLEKFKKIELKLSKRIKALETMLGTFCQYTYESGFFVPDNHEEMAKIIYLQELLAKKEARIAEIEGVINSLIKGKKNVRRSEGSS